MRLIESLHIEAFRGLRDLRLEGLGQINLLVGPNNCGKTSVLESIDFLQSLWGVVDFVMVGSARRQHTGLSHFEGLRWLFPQGRDGRIKLAVAGEWPLAEAQATLAVFAEVAEEAMVGAAGDGGVGPANGRERQGAEVAVAVTARGLGELAVTHRVVQGAPLRQELPLPMPESLAVRVEFTTPADVADEEYTRDRYSRLPAAQRKAVCELVRRFDPLVEDIAVVIPPEKQPVLLVEHGRLGRPPLSTFGDGLRRAVQLASAVSSAAGGLLLVDEIENSLHPSALATVFGWLVAACREHDVQLFATTHSLEALDAMVGAVGGQVDDLVAYHLAPRLERTHAERFSGDMLQRLVRERGLDVR